MNELTLLFHTVEETDPQSAEKLLPLVYQELRRMAANRMAAQPSNHTLQATALVHEAFLRLIGNPSHTWADRRHFFAAASQAMRHILVDRARRKAAARHGGSHAAVPWDELTIAADSVDEQRLAVNEALDELALHDATAAELVRLHFFGGFTFVEAAELLDVSERTAKRLWSYARAWLFDRMQHAEQVA